MEPSVFSSLLLVLPIFGLIFAGALAGLKGIMDANVGEGLNRFVVSLAIPAMLFNIVATSRWEDLWRPAFIAVFTLSGLAVLVVAIGLSYCKARKDLTDAAIDGLNGSYSNIGFLGFPLLMAAFGTEALQPTIISIIITMCLFFAGTIALVESRLQGSGYSGSLSLKVLKALIRNPILVAPLCGLPFSISGVQLPTPVQEFLRLLTGAASPCALVAIGIYLSLNRRILRTATSLAPLLVMCKLVIHPGCAWLLATKVFHLDPKLAHAAVILAALPSGTGSFMLADLYKRDPTTSTQVVILSTALSVVTIPLGLGILL